MADTAALPGPSGAVRRWAGGVVVAAALWGGAAVKKARAWRVHAAVPGVAGAGLVSAGLGLRFGLWLALIAAGLAFLRLDSRL
jgi:hypothetical protein